MAKKIIVTIEDESNVLYALTEVANKIQDGEHGGILGWSGDEWEISDTTKSVKMSDDELYKHLVEFIKTKVEKFGTPDKNGDKTIIYKDIQTTGVIPVSEDPEERLFLSTYDGSCYYMNENYMPTDIEAVSLDVLFTIASPLSNL